MEEPLYLLASQAMIELEAIRCDKEFGIKSFEKFKGVLEKNQLKDSDRCPTGGDFPHMALYRAIERTSKKEIKTASDLALEMRLLRYELDGIRKKSKEELKELIDFFTVMTEEFISESERTSHYRGLCGSSAYSYI